MDAGGARVDGAVGGVGGSAGLEGALGVHRRFESDGYYVSDALDT